MTRRRIVLNKEYIKDHVEMIPECGCWIWMPSLQTQGYGRIAFNQKNDKRKMLAHRTSYQIFKGNIPAGANVLHRCDMPSCVNPDHLFTGTQKDNMQDMIKKGRKFSVYKDIKFCKHGHEFTNANTYFYKERRQCKACKQERSRESRLVQKVSQ